LINLIPQSITNHEIADSPCDLADVATTSGRIHNIHALPRLPSVPIKQKKLSDLWSCRLSSNPKSPAVGTDAHSGGRELLLLVPEVNHLEQLSNPELMEWRAPCGPSHSQLASHARRRIGLRWSDAFVPPASRRVLPDPFVPLPGAVVQNINEVRVH
jgi:hypothetical protein